MSDSRNTGERRERAGSDLRLGEAECGRPSPPKDLSGSPSGNEGRVSRQLNLGPWGVPGDIRAGIHTVKLAFRDPGGLPWAERPRGRARIDELRRGFLTGDHFGPGKSSLNPEGPDGWKITGRPGDRVFGERTFSPLRHPGDVPAWIVPDLVGVLWDVKHPRWHRFLDGCVISRLDLAVDVPFESAAHGLAFLAGLGQYGFPRLEAFAHRGGSAREPRGVWFKRRRGGIVLRAYDHGSHRGYAEPGRVIRLESELRWSGRDCPRTRCLLGDEGVTWAAQQWERRLGPLAGIAVEYLPPEGIAVQLRKLADEGEILPGRIDALYGALVLARDPGHQLWLEGQSRSIRRTHQDRIKEARSAGLAVATLGDNTPARLDLRALVERVRTEPTLWGEPARVVPTA